MKLKFLTVTGFKSFPQRTKLHFAEGISAIVGPNGCGKSNIVDAIRWVLGEQTPAMIRAKSMDEVINNSDATKKTQFAEVTLTLSDTEKLQIPELEGSPTIEVARKITRSGDSEYRINGRLARLKDVQLIFMDTGVGTRAYSIIDQGQVSQFVEMDASKRRLILDEAAGIARYRLRRQETAKRLQDTQENLARLQDIISEVAAQRQKLSHQVASARRYLELRNQQERLQKALAAHSWQGLTQEDDALKVRQNASNAEHDEVISVLSALQARCGALEAKCALLETNMQETQRMLDQAEEKRKQAAYELSQREKQLISVEHNLKNHHANVEEQKRRSQHLERTIKQLDEETTQIIKDERELNQQIAAWEKDRKSITDLKDSIKQSLEEAKNNYVDIAAMYARLDSERRSAKNQHEKLKHKKLSIDREITTIFSEMEVKHTETKKLKINLSNLKADEEQLATQIKHNETIQRDLTDKHEETTKGIKATSDKLVEINAKLNALREVETSELKDIDKEMSNHKLLADHIQVKDNKEYLVDIALNELSQCHVVNLDDFEAMLKNLSNKLSLHRIIVPQLAHLEDDIDAENMLISCIKHEKSLSNFITQIAGKHKIAKNMTEAIEIAKLNKTLNNNNSVISETGEIILPTGEIKFTKNVIKKGIFTRRAELERLEKERIAFNEELSTLKQCKHGLETQISTINDEIKRLQLTVKKNQSQQNNLHLDIERSSHRSEILQDKHTQLKLEAEDADNQITEADIEIEQVEEKLEKIVVKKATYEGAIKGRETALRQQEEVIARRIKGMEGLKIRLAQVQLNLKNKRQDRQNAASKLERSKQETEYAAIRQAELEKTHISAKQAVQTNQEIFEEIEAEIYRQKRIIQQKREEYDLYRQELTGEKSKRKEYDTKLKEIERKLHQLELDNAQITQQIEQLKLYVTETFRADIADIWQTWLVQDISTDAAQKELKKLASELSGLGAVNLTAMEEFDAIEIRYNFLAEQKTDLETSIVDIKMAMEQLNQTCRQRLKETLEAVNKELSKVFPILFDGGEAFLTLTEGEDVLESGAEYNLKLPGKKIQNIGLLSGGEKAMAAIALIFSLFAIKPSPFCLLDEVDAPLDETNTLRFNRLVKKIAEGSQVALITHNQKVMEIADRLYGVTMEERGCSKIVSVDLR